MCCWTWFNNTPVIAKPTQSAPDEGDFRCTEQASWDLSWKRWKVGCLCCHVAFKWEPPWGSWRPLGRLPSLQFPKQYPNHQVLGSGSWFFNFTLEVSPLRGQKNQESGIQEGNWKPKASDKAWWLEDGAAIFWEETKGLGRCFRAEKADGWQTEI